MFTKEKEKAQTSKTAQSQQNRKRKRAMILKREAERIQKLKVQNRGEKADRDCRERETYQRKQNRAIEHSGETSMHSEGRCRRPKRGGGEDQTLTESRRVLLSPRKAKRKASKPKKEEEKETRGRKGGRATRLVATDRTMLKFECPFAQRVHNTPARVKDEQIRISERQNEQSQGTTSQVQRASKLHRHLKIGKVADTIIKF